MKLDNAETIPACREFFKHKPPKQNENSTIQFCKDSKSADIPPCSCSANGIDVQCTFRICGYQKGYYRDSDLPRFAASVAEEIKSWGPKSLVTTKFSGLADGTAWGDVKAPQPQPLPEIVKRCLIRASSEQIKALRILDERDHLDADLAILRGCALEAELAQSINDFQFDSVPTFSFDSRKLDKSDPNTRAAELKIVAANACGSLASWKSQKK